MSETYQCPRCIARGKDWDGDYPACGFTAAGHFRTGNWMCATLNALRDAFDDRKLWNDDDYALLAPIAELEDPEDEYGWYTTPGSFLVLNWYKSRGATDGAWVVDSGDCTPLTLTQAEHILAQAEARLGGDSCES